MQIEIGPRRRSRLPYILVTLAVLIIAGGLAAWILLPHIGGAGVARMARLRAWFADPSAHADWRIEAGQRCGDAPMILPTSGYIGFKYGDSFRPGHRHTGFDIFSPDGQENVTPVVAAYDGFLTREADWRSAVIIRHPDFPAFPTAPAGVPGSQIWTYYAHMASADGTQSYIAPDFPPGTYEVFVEAGTLLGYQGTWSGNPGNPTGLHLHFSVVKSAPGGGYANETDIRNTYDPAPFLGVEADDDGILTCNGEQTGETS